MKIFMMSLVLFGSSTAVFGAQISQYSKIVNLSVGDSYSFEQIFQRQGDLIKGQLIVHCMNRDAQKDIQQTQNPNISIREQGLARNATFEVDQTLFICQ